MADYSRKVTMRKACEEDTDVGYYIEDQPREARQRYETKLKYDKGQKSLPNPYKLSSGWVNDISTWPDITYGDIYNYLIDSPGVYTKQSMKAYKSLEAYRYVQSGHVQEVFYHGLNAEIPFCFLKARVVPSQRVNDKPHLPWICVGKDSGSIYCAHCTCMAGLGEACSHIAALMFKVQIAVHMGLTTKSSTSDICKWNSAFRKEIEPKTIGEMQKLLKAGNRMHPVTTVHATGRDPLPPKDILEQLKEVCPTAVFFTTIPPVGPEDTSIKETDKPKATETTPATLTSLYSTEQRIDDSELQHMCQEVWSNYSVTPDQAVAVEQSTRNQNECSRWYEHRKGRITASKAHDVFVRRDTTKPDNLVKRIVGYQSYDLSKTKSVRWGLDCEETARDQYGQAMKTVHSDFRLRKTGLLIDSRRPYLGASSDGIRECLCCGRGTVEIKCPYKHRNSKIDHAAKSDNNFCLDKDLKLKRGHKYYTQVQLQMYVHRVQFCDFIIYTECDMIVNIIPYDAEHCFQVINKCETFFMDHILPEILTKHLYSSGTTTCDSVEEDNVYCICQEPAYGKMVQCSNSDCPNEWFHYGCMNIRRKPRGAWFCPICKNL